MSGAVPRLAVIGGGVVGLTVAWRAAAHGWQVTVVDPAPGSGASYAAAGMLAPVTELHYTERDLLTLNLVAAGGYPAAVAQLEAAAGVEVGYRRTGTLAAAWDGADVQALRELYDVQRELGLEVEWLTGRELRRREPHLAPGIPGGVFVPGDHQVEPTRMVEALQRAGERAGVRSCRRPAAGVDAAGGRVRAVVLEGGERLACEAAVVSCGAWSGALDLPAGCAPPVRPVKGQTLHLAGGADLLGHVVRGTVRGVPVYLVPRGDGRIVVGATSEEVGFDTRPRAGAVYELLRDARALVPGVDELELVQVRTGLRPGSPDNGPLVGATGVEGLVVASGHYRNGVLLAPVTADAVLAVLGGEAPPPHWRPFTPARAAAAAGAGGGGQCG